MERKGNTWVIVVALVWLLVLLAVATPVLTTTASAATTTGAGGRGGGGVLLCRPLKRWLSPKLVVGAARTRRKKQRELADALTNAVKRIVALREAEAVDR